jgi:hypothetical protein
MVFASGLVGSLVEITLFVVLYVPRRGEDYLLANTGQAPGEGGLEARAPRKRAGMRSYVVE